MGEFTKLQERHVADEDRHHRLRERLLAVEQRIQSACRRAGRVRDDVTLVAVTKTVDADVARIIVNLGVHHLGENRPQELWRKAALLPSETRWHLIGHFQRNKIDRTLPLTHLTHSVDSVRLLEAMEKEAGRQNRAVPILLECNVSGEASKQGFRFDDAVALVPVLQNCKNIHAMGLMTMAPLLDAEQCRPTFRMLRELRDRLRAELPAPHAMTHLSMGMSNDFEVAIEEGATFIRLGSVLFEGLEA
jgi:pyridoxal phosphate enzyme (YggS family)